MLDWQLPTSIHKDPELTQMCMDSSPKLGLISLFLEVIHQIPSGDG